MILFLFSYILKLHKSFFCFFSVFHSTYFALQHIKLENQTLKYLWIYIIYFNSRKHELIQLKSKSKVTGNWETLLMFSPFSESYILKN